MDIAALFGNILLLTTVLQSDNAAFTIAPSPQVVVIGQTAVFRCLHDTSDLIQWRWNGSIVGVRNPPTGVIPRTTMADGVRVMDYTLSVEGFSEYNETEVVCTATLSGISVPDESTPATLLIQGSLNMVSNIERISSTVVWKAPFSLDLTGVDPDIVYSVEVYNITCGRRDLIIIDCNVTEPSFSSDDIALDGYIYEYTVTPRSNVEGARNGTRKTVTDKLVKLYESAMGQSLVFQMMDNLVMATLYLDIVIESGKRTYVKPPLYSTMLTSLDGLNNPGGFITTTTGNSDGPVTVVLSSLPFRRVMNVTLLAYACTQHSLLDNDIEIGTHDIYNISVASLSGTVTVTGDIISGSMSKGILIIAYSLTDETNTHYIFTPILPDQLRVNTMLMGLPPGQYQVSVFVIEESGLPFSRAAATPKKVQVDGQGQLASPTIEHEITMSDSSSICINCTFLDRSTTHCVVVVHQRISHLNSSGMMSIKSSHILNGTSNTAYGCIEGVNRTSFQVGVFGIRLKEGENKGSGTQIAFIAGIIVAVVLFVVLVVFIVLVTVIRLALRSNKKVKPSNETPDPVYDHTAHFASRRETPKEKEAENDYVMEYDTIQAGRIKPTNEDRLVSEYDVAQPERRERHAQEDRDVNEYDVVERDGNESTNEETEQYDDVVQGREKSKQYAEIGATASPMLMVGVDGHDRVTYSEVQSCAVEQESQEGADNAVVRSSEDHESRVDHDNNVEPVIAVTSETVSAFSSNERPSDATELVTLTEGGNRASKEVACVVRVSHCDSKVWQNKDLVLPGFKNSHASVSTHWSNSTRASSQSL